MVSIPVRVVRGARDGVALWLSAAIHGDEINGVEIIRQVIGRIDPAELVGTLVAVPIVNVFGFMHQSRYLPDRRDLNRSFPGSASGSLASRVARIFMTEVVDRCTHGIDLHTAAVGRMNLPQIRCDLEDHETLRCAEAFGAPVMIHSRGPGGSLRRAAVKRGKAVLVYEAGEVLRYTPTAIITGVEGVLRVMRSLGMLDEPLEQNVDPSVAIYKTKWVRAPRGGIVHMSVELGERVDKGQRLALVADPLGETQHWIKSPRDGYIIGGVTNPLVNHGDAVLHLALTPNAAVSVPKKPIVLSEDPEGAPRRGRSARGTRKALPGAGDKRKR